MTNKTQNTYHKTAKEAVDKILSLINEKKDITLMWDVESALFAGATRGFHIATELYPESLMLSRRIKQYCDSLKIKTNIGICSIAEIPGQEDGFNNIQELLKLNNGNPIPQFQLVGDKKLEIGMIFYDKNEEKINPITYKNHLSDISLGIDSDNSLNKEDKKILKDILPNYIASAYGDDITSAYGYRGKLPKKNAMALHVMYNKYVTCKPVNNILYIDNDVDYLEKQTGADIELIEKLGCKIQPVIIDATKSILPNKGYQPTSQQISIKEILQEFEQRIEIDKNQAKKELLELKEDIYSKKIELFNDDFPKAQIDALQKCKDELRKLKDKERITKREDKAETSHVNRLSTAREKMKDRYAFL